VCHCLGNAVAAVRNRNKEQTRNSTRHSCICRRVLTLFLLSSCALHLLQAPDMGGPSPAKPATPAKRRPAKRKASGSDDGDFEPKAPKPQSSPYIGVTKVALSDRGDPAVAWRPAHHDALDCC